MSKNITIKEDGTAQSLNGTARISVPRPDGSDATWVPEDECELGTIEIQQNGIYDAADFDLYGFHTVVIKVPKEDQIVGIGQDGNAYKITRDSTTGQIVRTEIPTKLEITQKPTVTEYAPGDTIDYSGMVVTLKSKDGSTFTDSTYSDGIIPASEIVCPAEVAEAGKTRLPVYWLSPYTSRVLKARFHIEIS